MAETPKLIFIDTNIWLDFYRAKSETALKLLKNLENLSEKIIITYQLEMEFKKNRHAAILDGLKDLKSPSTIPRPGIFSDAKAVKSINSAISTAESNVKKLRSKYIKVLVNPSIEDEVYKITQRIFRKNDPLVLKSGSEEDDKIYRLALKRFNLGYPPRKKNDSSIGDSFSWEWMLDCAKELNADLIIISRDSDYGTSINNKEYMNDHLAQEFRDRISQKRKIYLFFKISDALKFLKIKVGPLEEDEEKAIIQNQLKIDSENISSILKNTDIIQISLQEVEPIKPDLSPPKSDFANDSSEEEI